MSLSQIQELIRQPPAGLDDDRPPVVMNCVQRVLELYQESRQYQLSPTDRNMLVIRLLTAARRLDGLIQFNNRHPHDRDNRPYIALFDQIAAALKINPQQLRRTLDR
jgi:hypothetical protein